jgi:hypothetical protein
MVTYGTTHRNAHVSVTIENKIDMAKTKTQTLKFQTFFFYVSLPDINQYLKAKVLQLRIKLLEDNPIKL